MEFSPLLSILIIWLCIGLPISKMNQAKKRNTTRQAFLAHKNPNPPAQEALKPAPAEQAPPARETRLTPTVSVTEHDDSIYQGSLNAVTGEGMDPCHDEGLTGLNSAETAPPAHPVADVHSLPFGWNGSDMVRGIVVSEILNRKNVRSR